MRGLPGKWCAETARHVIVFGTYFQARTGLGPWGGLTPFGVRVAGGGSTPNCGSLQSEISFTVLRDTSSTNSCPFQDQTSVLRCDGQQAPRSDWSRMSNRIPSDTTASTSPPFPRSPTGKLFIRNGEPSSRPNTWAVTGGRPEWLNAHWKFQSRTASPETTAHAPRGRRSNFSVCSQNSPRLCPSFPAAVVSLRWW